KYLQKILTEAEQYFEFQKVAEGDRIALASFHLDGIALQWHRRKPQIFMIGDAEETENENPTNDALETQAHKVQGEISFHVISGTILPQILRLPRRIQNKDVVVLVDGGSHHKLQGLKASELSAPKSHELMGICDAALLLQIVSVLPQGQPELSPSPAIQKVLTDFCKVFQEPSGLPPPRFHDHSIPLLPG
nr:transposon Ty3-G Gag-Pol polyprotein [Tanacetum cinerariifolium]